MTNIYKSEYKGFRLLLNAILEKEDVTTKTQLSFIMKEKGMRYHKRWGNLRPTDKQLDIAWDYVKDKLGTWKEYKASYTYITIKSYSYVRNGKTIKVKSYKRKKNV